METILRKRQTLMGRIAPAVFLLALAVLTSAGAQTTAFSYQGTLTDQGQPANGSYDLQFKLYDSLGGGTQIGPTLTRGSVPVGNGGFTVSLDFGLLPFTGADRFLEISVRPPKGVFATLVPRTQILSSPYAVRALTVTGPINGTSTTATLSVTNDQPGITNPSFENLPPAALKAEATSTSNSNIGVIGIGRGAQGIGVIGVTSGVGSQEDADAIGVLASAISTTGRASGLLAENNTPAGTAIKANTVATGNLFQGNGNGVGGGNVVIYGTGSMEISGTMNIGTIPSSGNGPLCVLNTSPGVIRYCSSSLRYKRDVRPFAGGLDLVTRLRPITFRWKEDGSGDLGLAAEDVARVDQRLVFYNEKGEVEGVKYSQLNAVLVNAIRQQQEQIDKLQAHIDALTRRFSPGGLKRVHRRR